MPPSAWLLAWALLLLNAGLARAQCAHNPTITPNNLIFCPNSGSDTLWTQPYQAYQWFKDGVLQPGDTLRYRRVTSADAGSMFSVDATLNGCTERSPQVMVDGWVFLLPTVVTVGLQNPLCRGDTLLLILMAPYKVNIQWTNGGLPIPGANDDTLIVTTDGDYSVSGAPEICPAFVQNLGVVLSYTFLPCGGTPIAPEPGLSDNWFAPSKNLLIPNPGFAGNLSPLKLAHPLPLDARLEWLRLDGRLVHEEWIPASTDRLTLPPCLKPGLYHLRFTAGSRRVVHRWWYLP
jgi:hypothetical protein